MSVQLLQSTADVNEARANIFGALGDPNRLRIFQTLLEADDPLNVGEVCDRTDLSVNLVSHHLQCLKNCQLVEDERDGRKKFYEPSRSEAAEMLALADACIQQNIESVLGCEIILDSTTEPDTGVDS
jgi:DNA-binding transcriptional ArsR family regulator